MIGLRHIKVSIFSLVATLTLALTGTGRAEPAKKETPATHAQDPSTPEVSILEGLVRKASAFKPMEGFASYYAKRFEGRKTSSGHRYHPDKLTAAHHDLPLGTVVRVVNPATRQEVHVTVNDRCARKPFHFIDLSRAAAKKIGLLRKGTIKVVIIPLTQEPA